MRKLLLRRFAALTSTAGRVALRDWPALSDADHHPLTASRMGFRDE